MEWEIKYDNDTGRDDDGFIEWWTITDGDKYFKCYDESHAKWLCETLNNL